MDPRTLTHIGRYEVVRYVDEGAFAWVFEVRDLDPVFAGRRLALKMLKPEAARGDEFQRFKNEAAWLARIEHPNVVAIYDFGQDEATQNYYYAMSFVDGPTLKVRLKERGPLDVEEACRLFDGLLDGLEALHANQIVHRDIKPANVLLDSRGIARLGDLGIAREQTASSDGLLAPLPPHPGEQVRMGRECGVEQRVAVRHRSSRQMIPVAGPRATSGIPLPGWTRPGSR